MISPTPTPEFLSLLKAREGVRSTVYKDTLGFATCGVGHLLSADERAQYPLGSVVPEDVITQWEFADSTKAYLAAVNQAGILKIDSQEFVNVLASVSFQLGIRWFVHFPFTWKLLREHKWNEAAQEVQKSHWFQQTPIRVRDFQDALRLEAHKLTPDVPF